MYINYQGIIGLLIFGLSQGLRLHDSPTANYPPPPPPPFCPFPTQCGWGAKQLQSQPKCSMNIHTGRILNTDFEQLKPTYMFGQITFFQVSEES